MAEEIISEKKENQIPKKTNYTGLGLTLGLIFGSSTGLLYGMALDNLAAGFALGIGGGMCLGLAIGAGLDQRNKQNDG